VRWRQNPRDEQLQGQSRLSVSFVNLFAALTSVWLYFVVVAALPRRQGRLRSARRLLLVVGVVCCVGWAAVWYLGKRPVVVATAAGSAKLLKATPLGLLWVEQQGNDGPERLMLLESRRHGPREVAQAASIRGVVPFRDRILYLLQDGGAWSIQSLGREGQPEALLGGTGEADALWSDGEWLCWVETRSAVLPKASHVPVAGPLASLMAWRPDAERPMQVGVVDADDARFSGAFIAVADDCPYWWQQRGAKWGEAETLLRRGRLPAAMETLVRERGAQTAIAMGSELYWSAPSPEAQRSEVRTTVRRAGLSAESPTAVMDWLDRGGVLATREGHVYYSDWTGLWRLTGRPGLAAKPGGSREIFAIGRGMVYSLRPARSGGTDIRRVPAEPVGYLRNLLPGV
jgi:hypothetical protein